MSTLIAISGLGIICLLLEILNCRKALVPVVLLGLIGILGMTITEFYLGDSFIEHDKYNMIVETAFSRAFSILFILLTLFIILMCPLFYKEKASKIADYVALKIFLLAGAVAMVSFGNLAMFFIGIEVLSIAGYVLAASDTRNIRSNEAGMKYFIMGAFASSFILLGIAFVYGAVGSFDISTIAAAGSVQNLPFWFSIGFVMITVGLLFKASVAPFHFWAPDVYEGSPALVTALMSTLVKVAAIAALCKIVLIMMTCMTPSYKVLIMVLSILSMTIGNITALRQRNIKRMMAYSGISHAGFMIMDLLSNGGPGNAALYYAAAYSLAGIAAFAVIIAVCGTKDNEDISNFYGLVKSQPVLAFTLTGALMSLGGIPVFAGFFAKFFIFDNMLEAGNLTLVIFGIINSIIAVYYYFRLINVMFTKEPTDKTSSVVAIEYKVVAVAALVLNILLGIFPSIVMGLQL